MNKSRVLLIVPILHTKEDMGSLGSRLPQKDGYLSMASKFWEEVKEKVKRYIDGFQKVKVYQDGLPDTQEDLVNKIISTVKSPNYQLLRFLKSKGAKVFGTEDPKLLKEEYEKITSEVARRDSSDGGLKKAADLLAQRDAYIAKRIDETLKEGDLGILFLGAAHEIQNKLPKDIQVEIL